MTLFIGLGYYTYSYATSHQTFLVTGGELDEMSYYERGLEFPNLFARDFPQNLNTDQVLVTRAGGGFFFGVQGNLLQAQDNQTDYVISDPSPMLGTTFPPSGVSTLHSVDPDYDYGYGAYIGYVYPYSGRDIELSGFNFRGTSNDNVFAPPNGGTLWTTVIPLIATNANAAQSRYSTNAIVANLKVGQHIFAGARFHIRPAMGLKYAYIQRDLNSTFSGVSLLEDSVGGAQVFQKSRFNGIGPQVSLEGTYYFSHCFGIKGYLNPAILIGTINSSIQASTNTVATGIDSSGATTVTTTTTLTPINRENLNKPDRVVPALEGKLGAIFTYPYGRSKLNIEVGYDFNQFFNAVDIYRSTANRIGSQHIKHPTDLAFQGPYLSVGVSDITCPTDVVIPPFCVASPNLIGGLEFGIGVAYFRTHNNQQAFALVDSLPGTEDGGLFFTFPSNQAKLANVNAQYSPGLLAHIGYIFGQTPYDIDVNYVGVQNNNTQEVTAPTGGGIWTILSTDTFGSFLRPLIAQAASARLKYNYQAVNFEIGQRIDVDSVLLMRVFEGVRYAHIDSNLHTTYQHVQTVSSVVTYAQENVIQKSLFNGLGPRVGLDLTFPLGTFALTSQLAGGILVGSTDASIRDELPIPTGVADFALPTIQGIDYNADTQSSPFLDLKIAALLNWSSFLASNWRIELGYMVSHYFNAGATFRHAQLGGDFIKQVNDISVEGPYLEITLTGIGNCPAECIRRDPFPAFIPVLRGGFEFAIEALYLEPHASNLDYAVLDPTPIEFPISFLGFLPSSNSSLQTIKSNYDFGYRLHVGYIFPLSANDMSLNYHKLTQSNRNSVVAPVDGVIWTNLTDSTTLATFGVTANRASASVDFDWEGINLEFGRRVQFHNLLVRGFAGVSLDKVNENSDVIYTDLMTLRALSIATDEVTQKNHYRGFGPRLGFDIDLLLGCHFAVVAQAATDLLVGNVETRLFEINSLGDSTVIDPNSTTRVVPTFDGKLGLAYIFPFSDCCSSVRVEAGYQFNHYFNVKDSLRFTSSNIPGTIIKQDQDIGFDGVYAKLQVNL